MISPTIDLLFPKPVYRVHDVLVEHLDTFSDKIHSILDNVNSKRTGSLNVDSSHSVSDQLHTIPEFKILADTCMDFARDFMSKMIYDQYIIDNCKYHKMWANISNQNDFLFPHIHGTCIIAGVYYISAPQGAMLTMHDDLKSIKHESKQYNHMTYEEYNYNCIPGTVLLFKNDMLHSNKAQPLGEKIAISFNIGL